MCVLVFFRRCEDETLKLFCCPCAAEHGAHHAVPERGGASWGSGDHRDASLPGLGAGAALQVSREAALPHLQRLVHGPTFTPDFSYLMNPSVLVFPLHPAAPAVITHCLRQDHFKCQCKTKEFQSNKKILFTHLISIIAHNPACFSSRKWIFSKPQTCDNVRASLGLSVPAEYLPGGVRRLCQVVCSLQPSAQCRRGVDHNYGFCNLSLSSNTEANRRGYWQIWNQFDPSPVAAGCWLPPSRQCSLTHALPQVSDREDTPEGPWPCWSLERALTGALTPAMPDLGDQKHNRPSLTTFVCFLLGGNDVCRESRCD